jgi:hypothetical protein
MNKRELKTKFKVQFAKLNLQGLINSLIVMTTLLFVKSLLTSLCQREEFNPSLAKRGKGRFFDLYKFNGFEVSLQKLFHHVCLPSQVRIWT